MGYFKRTFMKPFKSPFLRLLKRTFMRTINVLIKIPMNVLLKDNRFLFPCYKAMWKIKLWEQLFCLRYSSTDSLVIVLLLLKHVALRHLLRTKKGKLLLFKEELKSSSMQPQQYMARRSTWTVEYSCQLEFPLLYSF